MTIAPPAQAGQDQEGFHPYPPRQASPYLISTTRISKIKVLPASG